MIDDQIPMGLLRRLAAGSLSEEELDLVQAWLTSEGLTRPPASVLRRAQRIPREGRPSALRRLVAMLVSDSGFQPALAGVRGPDRSRYLTYVVGDIELVLELSASGSGAQTVVGQITGGEGWIAAHVETEGDEQLETTVDPVGMFAFPPIVSPRVVTIRGDILEMKADLPREMSSAQ